MSLIPYAIFAIVRHIIRRMQVFLLDYLLVNVFHFVAVNSYVWSFNMCVFFTSCNAITVQAVGVGSCSGTTAAAYAAAIG